MAMPTVPVANLILGKARLAFGPLQAFLDAMLRLGHTGKLRQRRLGRGVRRVHAGGEVEMHGPGTALDSGDTDGVSLFMEVGYFGRSRREVRR